MISRWGFLIAALISMAAAAPASANVIRQGAVYSTAQPQLQSFLRFVNTGTHAGTVKVDLYNADTGTAAGSWTSPSIATGSAQQYAISTIESGLTAGASKPNYYFVIIHPGITGYYQHVLWRPSDGTLTNLSTCNVQSTASSTLLNAVHSSLLSGGYPSTVVVNNTASSSKSVTLGIYNAATGTKLGTYAPPAIAGGGSALILVKTIETAIGLTPSATQFHYIVKAEGTFAGSLQHLVTNVSAGVVTDMTTMCALTREKPPNTPPATQSQGAIYSTAQTASQSFLRFYNAGTSADTVSVALKDSATGQTYAQWTSPSIPAGASQQFFIADMEARALPGAVKPAYYSVAITSTMNGFFQHVLWRPADGTLTNLSTCGFGVTANPGRLTNVHSSLLDNGYPSSVVAVNTGIAPAAANLGIYDAATGTKLGTYTSATIPVNGEAIIAIDQIEAAANITPAAGQYHYLIKTETFFTGYLQHLVNNKSAGVITDMTTVCRLPSYEGATSFTYTKLPSSKFLNIGSVATYYVARIDLDGDGLDDLVLGGDNTSSTNPQPIVALRSNGDGTFTNITATVFPSKPTAKNPWSAHADINEDGIDDFIIYDEGDLVTSAQFPNGFFAGGQPNALLLSNGSGAWTSSTILSDFYKSVISVTSIGAQNLNVADIDGDGNLDILAETGGESPPGETPVKTSTGTAPYLVGHFLMGDGKGHFTLDFDNRLPLSILQGQPQHTSGRYWGERFVDMNGDGKPDLIMGRKKRPNNDQEWLNNKVVINDGKGYFPLSNAIDLPPVKWLNDYTRVLGIAVLDLNADGRPDLILAHNSGSDPVNTCCTGRYLQALIQNANGSYTDVSDATFGDQSPTEVLSTTDYGANFNAGFDFEVVVDDLNNDGRPDFAMAAANADIGTAAPYAYIQTHTGSYKVQDPTLITNGQLYQGAYPYPIDLDGDGVMDLVALNYLPGKDGIYGTGDEVTEIQSWLVTLPP